MKMNWMFIMSVFMLTVFVLVRASQAEGEAPVAQAQSQETVSKGSPSTRMKSDMMGQMMDTDQMMTMMHECKKMHKDAKVCNHEAMGKCEETMKKEECAKIMKKAKVATAPEKKSSY